MAGGEHVFGQLCCGNPHLSDCSFRLQQGCERSGIDRILRSWFVGTFKHFTAATAVNLNSKSCSATLSYSTFEDDRECNARSPCDPCIPVPCCKLWPARPSQRNSFPKAALACEPAPGKFLPIFSGLKVVYQKFLLYTNGFIF